MPLLRKLFTFERFDFMMGLIYPAFHNFIILFYTMRVVSAGVVADVPNPITMLSSSGTTFLIGFICCVGGGIILFAIWDCYESRTFKRNQEIIERNKDAVESPEFNLRDAFTSSGVTGQSVVPMSRRLNANSVQPDGAAPVRRRQSVWDRVNQPVDLLQDNGNTILYAQALLKHHPLLRMFTYGSLRVTRVLRFVQFSSDILLLLYITTLFYATSFPNDNGCTTYKKYERCIVQEAKWLDGDTLCSWNWPKLKCSMRLPTQTMTYFAIAASVILAVALIPMTLIKWAFEYVYTKEVTLALQAIEAGDDEIGRRGSVFPFRRMSVSPRPAAPPAAQIGGGGGGGSRSGTPDRGMRRNDSASSVLRGMLRSESGKSLTPEEREARKKELKMKRVLNHAMHQMDVDERERNRVIMQHFVEEHLAAHEGFFVRNHFFTLDHAKPETLGCVGFLLWLFTFAATVSLWVFFVYYTYMWLLVTDSLIVSAWITTFLASWALKVFAFDFVGVFLMYVLPVVLLRDKLRDIYDIIAGASPGAVDGKVVKSEEGHAGGKSALKSGFDNERGATRTVQFRRDSATAEAVAQLGAQGVGRGAAALILNLDSEASNKLMEVKSRKASLRPQSPTIANSRPSLWKNESTPDAANNRSLDSALEAARTAALAPQSEDQKRRHVLKASPLAAASATKGEPPKGRKIMM